MNSESSIVEGRRSPERRSQEQRRSEAESAILKAAVHIVAERGLERFTLADVGEAAGYSRGLPAHYFGSKEGLVSALARHIVRNFGHALQRSDRHTAGLAHLIAMATFYFDSAGKDPARTRVLFAVLGDALTNPLLRKEMAELNAQSVAAIANDIRAGVASGEIRKGVNPKTTAALALSGLRGAVALWLTNPGGIDLKTLRNEFVAELKRSLAA